MAVYTIDGEKFLEWYFDTDKEEFPEIKEIVEAMRKGTFTPDSEAYETYGADSPAFKAFAKSGKQRKPYKKRAVSIEPKQAEKPRECKTCPNIIGRHKGQQFCKGCAKARTKMAKRKYDKKLHQALREQEPVKAVPLPGPHKEHGRPDFQGEPDPD